MPLPNDIRQQLADEFRYVAEQMAQAPDLPTKLYFFSAFFGEAQRVLNRSWDRDLALLHLVTQTAYQALNHRVQQIASGADRVVGIPPDVSPALDQVVADLANIFAATEPDVTRLQEVLGRVAELAYVTNGNGHYLWLKGLIKV